MKLAADSIWYNRTQAVPCELIPIYTLLQNKSNINIYIYIYIYMCVCVFVYDLRNRDEP